MRYRPSRSSLCAFAVGLGLQACTGTGTVSPELRADALSTSAAAEQEGAADQAYRWRRMRWLDDHGRVASDARAVALAERAANLAESALVDDGGIGPFSWRAVGPTNIGGRTRCLLIHPTVPSRMWAGAVSGGIWRTDDGGNTWVSVDDRMGNLAITSLVMDPSNPAVMYASTGEGFEPAEGVNLVNIAQMVAGAGIWKSLDGGVTWSHLPGTENLGNINRLAIKPGSTDIVLAGCSGMPPGFAAGVYRTANGGATWSVVLSLGSGSGPGPTCYQVLFDPNDTNRCVASVSEGNAPSYSVHYGSGSGQFWSRAQTGLRDSANRVELTYVPTQANTLLASVGTDTVGGGNAPARVWRSTNHGRDWASLPSAGLVGRQSWYDNAIWVDPTNANRMLVGMVTISRSIDGGNSFTVISNGGQGGNTPHSDVHFFAHHPGYNGSSVLEVFTCTDGGVYRAPNILTAGVGGGWQRRDQGFCTTQFYGAAGDGPTGRITGGTQDNGHLTIDSASTSNAIVTRSGDGGFAAMDPTDPNYLYGEYVNLQIFRSTNGGAGSSYIYSGITDAGNATTTNFIAPFVLDPNDPNRMLAGGRGLWRSNNVKAASPSWGRVYNYTGTNDERRIAAIAVAPGNSNVAWFGDNQGRLRRSSNATAGSPTWSNSSSPANRFVGRILIDRTSSSTVFVGFGGFGTDNLYRTTNSGSSWSNVSGSGATALPRAPIYGIAQHPTLPGRYYVATEVGVFATSDDCATWSTSNDGPADVCVDDIRFLKNSDVLLAATYGRGLWTSEVHEGTSTVFGAGCPGSAGTPALDAAAPRIGVPVVVTVTNVPAAAVTSVVFGISDTIWGGVPLPRSLAAFGMPGCTQFISAEIAVSGLAAGGSFQYALGLPPDPAFVGTSFFSQAIVADAAANQGGAVVTNAVRCELGN
ncbi:MAG: hypothetical protein KDE27_32855 [Planctomycetes bacterium]|nr:hypothetical protein [Planctomycetota bacterium]